MINRVTLVGYVTADAETKNVSGSYLMNFTVATNKKWKDKSTGEWQEKSEFTRISCWNNTATYLKDRVHKGTLLYVEGELQTRSWEDNQGVKRYSTDVNANLVKVLRPAKGVDTTDKTYDNGQVDVPNHAPAVNSGEPLPF